MSSYRKFFYFYFLPVYAVFLYIIIFKYTDGDQRVYRTLYNVFSVTDWKDVFKVSISYVTGYEIVSPYILWLGAKLGIEKDIYVTFLNLVLAVIISKWLFSHKVNLFFVLLILSGFYLLVLYTGAERLKISYIFLALAALYMNGRKVFIVFLLLAVLSHLQSVLLVAGLVIYFFSKEYGAGILNFKLNKKIIFKFTLLFLLGLLVFFLLGDAILRKGLGYSSGVSKRDATVLLQAVILYFSVYFIVGRNPSFVLMTLYFMACTYILGGSRVNMIYFTAVLFVLVNEGHLVKLHKVNLLFSAVLLYFSYKSLGFLNNILVYGDGFYS